jgi:folate-binding protein YgfZ
MTLTAPTPAYTALTEGCGWVDHSARGKLLLTGEDAAEFLNGQLSNDIVALAQGHGCYAALLTPKGKMLADVRALRLTPGTGIEPDADGVWLDTERVALQGLFDTLRRYRIGYRVELHKRTLEQGLISLIGPASGERAAALAGLDAAALPASEHDHRRVRLGGVDVLLVATDLGFDLVCDAADTAPLARALADGGITTAEEADAEVARVERGRPRYGIELDDSVIPQEAGLNERAVSFTKGCYVGQETVARLYYRGKPNRHLRGLRFSGVGAEGGVRGVGGVGGVGGVPLFKGERVVGQVASAVVSPRWGPIGLALVRREVEPGEEVTAGEKGIRARVVDLPFG